MMRGIATLLLLACAAHAPSLWADEPAQEIRDPGFYAERLPRLDLFDVYDPWEGFNRGAYAFNYQVDRFVLLPAVKVYRRVVPGIARTGVRNFWNNLWEVQNLSASLLQLKFRKAARTVARFTLNSTVGLAGLIDVADREGLPDAREDLGQVLGYWGLGPGPYLVIPFLGPSSVRDGIGLAGDSALFYEANIAGIPDELSQSTYLSISYAISTRDAVPFRYGQLKSPFEYEMVRFAITRARVLLIAE